MTTRPKHIFLVAGEASGDLHAAHLVAEIRRLAPDTRFSGVGGTKMCENGVELYEDLTRLAVIGFTEVIKHYADIKRIFQLIIAKVKETRPDAVVLVDYPGFNLRLAPELKKLGVKVIYYISPQVWAWKENRVEKIRAFTDRMLVLFEFEQKLYRRHGIEVDFVGHPLLDTVQTTATAAETRKALRIDPNNLTFGLLPGSRRKEIDSLLPTMLEAAALLAKKFPAAQFLLVKAPTITSEILQPHLSRASVPVRITATNTYDAIAACDLCMVASGTATLETAILGKPMVVVYKTSLITWLLARLLVKIPYIGLVNVVAEKKIVPECVQFDATAEKISGELIKIADDKTLWQDIQQELQKVKSALGHPGASRRAAEIILKRGHTT